MKELTESSYLVPSSKCIILEHGQTLCQSHGEELQDLVLVHLNRLFLNNVDYLQYCTSIKICTLSNNYITNIDALRICSQLVKLDLHGNQLQVLPGQDFWSELRELQLLYLHDNGIGKLKNVQALSSCANLIGLTLFDTPVSLKKDYRHFVVNSIWSLKVLDNYVISDAEIIEDCNIPDTFKPFIPRLFLNILPALKKETSFQDEISEVKEIISKINHILAHNSPILIIQRRIRGYLTRKRLGQIHSYKTPEESYHVLQEFKSVTGQSTDFYTDGTRCIYRISKPEQNNDKRSSSLKKQTAMSCPRPSIDRVMHITVDLRKLQKEISQVEQSQKAGKESTDTSPRDHQQRIASILAMPKRDENKQQRRFSKSCQQEMLVQTDLQENEKTEFRLSGFKANLHKPDTISNILTSHNESAKDIRDSVNLLHSITHSKPNLLHHRPSSFGKKVFSKTNISVTFSPLYAIDKAYEERKRSEMLEEKMQKVCHMHSVNGEAKFNVNGFLQEKKNDALRMRDLDGLKLEKAVLQLQLRKSESTPKIKERHMKFKEQKKQKESDCLFTQGFRTKYTSVTNTLLKHDREIVLEDDALEKSRLLMGLRQQGVQQRLLSKDLKEYRKSMLQRDNAAEKVEVCAAIFQNANDRLLQARAHVAAVKSNQATVEPMYRIPVAQTVYKEAYLKYFST